MGLNDAHNKGEQDAAAGNNVAPHGNIDIFMTNLFQGEEARDKLIAENEAYQAGQDNARKQGQ